jgi:hypothetical protein
MINFAPFCVFNSQRDGVRSARARTRRKSLLATYRIRLEVASFCVDKRGHAYNRTDGFFKGSFGTWEEGGVIPSRGKFCSQQTKVSLPQVGGRLFSLHVPKYEILRLFFTLINST